MSAQTFTTDATAAKCGAWTLEVTAMDPILLSTLGAAASDGLMARFRGNMTLVTTQANGQVSGGFCIQGAAAAERAFCVAPVFQTDHTCDAATSLVYLVATATYGDLTKKHYADADSGANIEWLLPAYQGEGSWADAKAAALLECKKLAASGVRASYWLPKAAATTATGVPPMLSYGTTVSYKCLAAVANADRVLSAGGTFALTGTAVTTAARPAGSYAGAAGEVVLHRPTEFLAANDAATTAPGNLPLSAFNPESVTTDLACQGSWLKVEAATQAQWATDSTGNAPLVAYTQGLKMTIRTRIHRTYKAFAAGLTADKSVQLCVKLAFAASGMTLTEEDPNSTAVCFFVLSGANTFTDAAGLDMAAQGFKTKDVDAFRTVALMKPALLVASYAAGRAAGSLADSGTDIVNATTIQKAAWKLEEKTYDGATAIAKNATCNSAWQGAGACGASVSFYLSKAVKQAAVPFHPQNGDKFTSFCAKNASWQLGAPQTSPAALAGAPAALDLPGNAANAAVTAAAPATPTTSASMAMLTGTAAVPLTAGLDVAGMDSAAYALAFTTAEAKAWTDGYELTSRITLTADNTKTGTVAVCYVCASTSCTTKTGYCHAITGITSALNIPVNAHSVVLVAAAATALAKHTETGPGAKSNTGVSPMAGLAALPAGLPSIHAAVSIHTPVASTANSTAAARPLTKGCLGCLVKKPATPATGRAGDGLLTAKWYQPMANNSATAGDGPRFDTGLEVLAWGVAGANVLKGTAVAITKLGAAALATGLAGVAAGAAALAM